MSTAANLILENVNIITCDPLKPRAEALAERDGWILQVGSRQETAEFKGSNTRVIDCLGKTLIPGFYDAHCHFFSGLRKLFSLDLSPAAIRSIPELQSAIRRKTQYVPKGVWISGTDYNEFYLAEKRHPTCRDLDAAAPNHPVFITHRSLHACVLNSLAMQKIGINNESEEPTGGIIERDLETGEPNGILYEMLAWAQERIKSPLSQEEYQWGLNELNQQYLSMGITSFTDATVTNNLAQAETFSRLIKEEVIKSRVNLMLGSSKLAEYQKFRKVHNANDLNLKVNCLKIVVSQATGQTQPIQSELNQSVFEANQAGFQVAIHAVEKDSIEAAVTALEYSQSRLHVKDRRNRIEHCSECPAELVSQLARLKAVIVSQPPFLYFQGERYLDQVPVETQPYLYPFKSLIEAGLSVAGSSDAPVASNNPLIGIYSAVTRRAQSGQILLPAERLTAGQALNMFTREAAYASFEENEKGSLKQGYMADMVMLSDDPLNCQTELIKDIRVEKTMIRGKMVWEKK